MTACDFYKIKYKKSRIAIQQMNGMRRNKSLIEVLRFVTKKVFLNRMEIFWGFY